MSGSQGFIVAVVLTLALACTPRTGSQAPSGDNPELAKLSSRLLEARRLAAAGASDDEIRAAVPLLELREGRARVEIALERLTPELLEALRRAGLEEQSHSLRHARVYGWVGLDRLDEIAALPEVSTIRHYPAAGTRRAAPGPARRAPDSPL